MSRLAILLMLVGCQSQPTLQPVGSTFVVTEIEGRSIESRAATTPESSSGNALPPSEQQQPRDGAARDFQTVDELRMQLGLMESELTEAKANLKDSEKRLKDARDSIEKLRQWRIAELDQLSTVGDAWPMLTVIGADWCGHCQAWKKSPGDLPKRFIDEHDARPADITESEWAGIQADRASVAALPFVFWRAKSGQIKWLVGRYSDKQLQWSIKEADRLNELKPATRPSGSIALMSRAA